MLKKVIREKDKEKLDMNVFKELGKDLNYKDILQVDGAFSACHINYGKSLKFNGADSKNMAQNSRKNSLTENGHIDDLEAVQYDFNGTEKDFKKQDIILLWEKYWLEYINAFNKLVAELPDSILCVGSYEPIVPRNFCRIDKKEFENSFTLNILENIRQSMEELINTEGKEKVFEFLKNLLGKKYAQRKLFAEEDNLYGTVAAGSLYLLPAMLGKTYSLITGEEFW